MIFIGMLMLGILIAGFFFGNILLTAASVSALVIAHAWRNNTMMTYVEKNAYGGTGK